MKHTSHNLSGKQNDSQQKSRRYGQNKNRPIEQHHPKGAGSAFPGQDEAKMCIRDRLGILRLVFEIRGKGTAWLAQRQTGDNLDIVGPLGHGFPAADPAKKAVLVGGGIGTPPLLPVARFYGGNATVITGFRNGAAAILQEDFAAAGAHTVLCTDDGSAGFHGFTTQALEQHLAQNACDVVYTCGPKVMMKGVAAIAADRGISCYVSMEERMGCGVGA